MSRARRRVATVLVPTHDHHETLDLAVGSALGQTVSDIEVVVIGDGVTPEVRACARRLAAGDDRVRFLDLPKGRHHGETYRDTAVRRANSDIICYLCDDDLLLPEHVGDMVALLADHDLVHCLNGYLEPDGEFHPYLADLSSPAFRRWLLHPHRNAVSVTGTAHTVAAYRRLPVGWEVPPPGREPDHFMWQKFLVIPELRAATSDRVTALQFPSHLASRRSWSSSERRAEIERWTVLLHDGEARRRFQDETRAVVMRAAGYWRSYADVRADHELRMQAHIDALELSLERERAWTTAERTAGAEARRADAMARDAAERRVAELERRLELIEGSRTWRLRCWLRGARSAPRDREPGGSDRR